MTDTAVPAEFGTLSRRGQELLVGSIEFLRTQGVEQFSLAAVAEYLGTSSRMLIYHLGTSDVFLARVLTRRRFDTSRHLRRTPVTSLSDAGRRIWDYYLHNQWEMRLFFFVSTKVFEDPTPYQQFAETSSSVWLDMLVGGGVGEGMDADRALANASYALAAIRGLFLDLFLTGHHERVTAGFEALAWQLDRWTRPDPSSP